MSKKGLDSSVAAASISLKTLTTKNLPVAPWKRGALIGVVIGFIGTFLTYVTGDISVISIPVVLLFSLFGGGLLFLSLLFELITVALFYAMVGAIIGYLTGRKRK